MVGWLSMVCSGCHRSVSHRHHVALKRGCRAVRRTLPSSRKRVHSGFWLQALFLGSKRAQLGFCRWRLSGIDMIAGCFQSANAPTNEKRRHRRPHKNPLSETQVLPSGSRQPRNRQGILRVGAATFHRHFVGQLADMVEVGRAVEHRAAELDVE